VKDAANVVDVVISLAETRLKSGERAAKDERW
jgi:hypothetical protein